MNVVVINNEEELTSFPITQVLKLKLDTTVDINDLKNTVFLFRVPRKDSLINLSSPYNYNLGLIKESFDIVDIEFELVQNVDYVELRITPTNPLQVQSTYLLFVSDKLSEPFITVTKTNSKSKSSIKVAPTDYLSNKQYMLDIKILNNTVITPNNYTLQVQIEDLLTNTSTTETLNLNKNRSITVREMCITFESPVYIQDELFSVLINHRESLGTSLSQVITTASDKNITPLVNQEASTKLSNQAILDFYTKATPTTVDIKYKINYLDENVFELIFPSEINVELIDLTRITAKTKVAFNNYILKKLKLYDDTIKYVLYVNTDTYNNSLLFELVISEDPLQVAEIVVVG